MIPISDESWRFTASSQKGIFCDDSTFLCGAPVFFFTSAVFCSGCSFSNKFYCEARGFFGGERELFKYSEVRDSKKRSEDTAPHLSAALSPDWCADTTEGAGVRFSASFRLPSSLFSFNPTRDVCSHRLSTCWTRWSDVEPRRVFIAPMWR